MFISVLLPLPELPMIATQIAGVDPQRDVAQRAHPDLPELEYLGDLVHLDDRMSRATPVATPEAPPDVARSHQRPATRRARVGFACASAGAGISHRL